MEEERLWSSCESLNSSSKYMDIDGHLSVDPGHSQACSDKLLPDNAQLESNPHSIISSGGQVNQSRSAGTCMEQANNASTSRSSIFETCTSSKPDFSILRGEICLDDLSIRELQEAFWATFGRQTSVKDKLWLKRRIAMGLTNSCDIPDTRFVIKGNKIVQNNMKEESSYKEHIEVPENNFLHTDQVTVSMNDHSGGSASSFAHQLAGEQALSGKRDQKPPTTNSEAKPEHTQEDHCATKRIRKPTRRYIEELSKIETRESTGKLFAAVKNSGLGHCSPKSLIRPVRGTGSRGATLVTRKDFLGGSSIHIPYVCRVRRGRPRRDILALLNFVGMDTKERNIEMSTSGENRAHRHEQINIPGDHSDDNANTIPVSEHDTSGIVFCGDDSDDNANAVPTLAGGAKRKHHRAWTLCEVLKLVEGVARYGAGRWSEIRRLAFASYSYRTSVDLKDKWRNLLRASFAQSPTENSSRNFRKHSSIPIPTPILLRVRELAEMDSQAGLEFRPSKFPSNGGRIVQEEGSGFV